MTSACVSPRVNRAEPWVRGSAPDFAPDGANFVEFAAIGTAARIQHFIAENAFFQNVEELVGFLLLLFGASSTTRVVQRVDAGVAFELLVFLRIQRVGQFVADLLVDGGEQFRD